MLLANLQESEGSVVKTDAYRSLDGSEKAAVSYFIGLTVAGLVARHLFDVRWLMHLDVYQRSLHPGLPRSHRPDLVGADELGRWYVIEAKGRSNGADRRVLARAKEQTLKLRQVCGEKPRLRVASVAYFSRGGCLSLNLADPVAHHRDAIDWSFAEEKFLRDYYQPYVDLLSPNNRAVAAVDDSDIDVVELNGRQVLVVALPDVDLEIGLASRVYDLLRSKRLGREEINEALGLGDTRFPTTDMPPSNLLGVPLFPDGTFLGPDGILVRLGSSWIDEQEKEPQPALW